MSLNWYKEQDSWVLQTGKFGSTEAIGLSFVFLAYFLHPAVEAAFQRVRAYGGWCAVEKRQTVEVTTYPLWAEIFCGRRRWDSARIVTVLLAAFSLASWILELQLDLAYVEGNVIDLYLRPPPVWMSGTTWCVEPSSGFLELAYDEMGTNMDGNFSRGTARAIYKLDGSEKIHGVVQVASWSTNVNDLKTRNSYNDNETGITHVTNHSCEAVEKSGDLYEKNGTEKWGEVQECSHGPGKKNRDDSTAPALKLTNDKTGDVHFIIEESSTYPSFLYSVWRAENKTDDSTFLRHVFHILSSARLAEALVTEIVHASQRRGDSKEPTGGGAFALLRKFSETYSKYDIQPQQRASPFGELPRDESLINTPLSSLETIEAGIKLNTIALLCAVWLVALTLVGIAWSFVLRSRIGMDIYDRDELIRNVTSQTSSNDAEHASKMRIFVRKENGGNLSVVVSEFEERGKGCARIFRMKHQTVAVEDPVPIGAPNHASEFGGSIMAPGSRAVCLEGVRMGNARTFPGRRGNYNYPTSIALSASPVPSHVGSIVGTPVPLITSSASIPLPNRPVLSLGSALFESTNDLDESGKHRIDIEMARITCSEEPNAELCKKRGVLDPLPSKSRQTKDFDRWELQVHSESTATINDQPTTPPARGSMFRPTVELPERSGQLTGVLDERKDEPNSHRENE